MKKSILFFSLLLASSITVAQSTWKKINSETSRSRNLDKKHSEVLEVDFNSFRKSLKNTPLRGVNTGRNTSKLISLPDENGNETTFKVYEVRTFEKSFYEDYPEIRSYKGYADNGAIATISVDPSGVHTMISYKDKPTVFMEPLTKGNPNKHITYNRLSREGQKKENFLCTTKGEIHEGNKTHISQRIDEGGANDQMLKVFRFVISTNGEYTMYHGGRRGALAAINTTMTRVNAVYEVDLAIKFEIQNYPDLIYTNSSTDPYSHHSQGAQGAWNMELQKTLTNEIGNDAYDIGHFFGSAGGGGNAGCIGCVCEDYRPGGRPMKGSAYTSPSNGRPEGDAFDIDYVCHEIGHQMGANHTFSHKNEGKGVNVEPGGGTTIMGYAGITKSNVQMNSDPYFNYHSIRQITENVLDFNHRCWESNNSTRIRNNPPAANAGKDYTIPKGTAYILKGAAKDSDDQTLYYCWEQIDDGTVNQYDFGPEKTKGAQTRSLSPVTQPYRFIPKLERIIAGKLTESSPKTGGDWETVSNVGRKLQWALTVRDRTVGRLGQGGQTSFDTMTITVDRNASPFKVTSPSAVTTFTGNKKETITWEVGRTNSTPINCKTVDIYLSMDGGKSFEPIIEGTANDGSEDVLIPNKSTSNARIMVMAADNVFLAVNNGNFKIKQGSSQPDASLSLNVTNNEQNSCNGADVTYDINVKMSGGTSVKLSATGNPSGSRISFSPSYISSSQVVKMTVSGLSYASAKEYPIKVSATMGTEQAETQVTLNVLEGSGDITLTTPSNQAEDVSLTPDFTWEGNASEYKFELSESENFYSNIISETVITNKYTLLRKLETSKTYYWRISSKGLCGDSKSKVYSFSTRRCTPCKSHGHTRYETAITSVNFAGINNTSGKDAKDNGYSDYKSQIAEVRTNENHNMTINVNTDGNQRVHVKVWIDWNQNCQFDADEAYDLGIAQGTPNGPTANAPLKITVPSNAPRGKTTMRVSVKNINITSSPPSSCGQYFDGEVEDYTVNVIGESASVENFNFENFNIYPNPTTGTVTIVFNTTENKKVSVKLIDMRGRLISTKNFTANSTVFNETINYSFLNSGIYLLQVTNGNKQTTKKLVIK